MLASNIVPAETAPWIEAPIFVRFAAHALERPQAIAVIDADGQITYDALYRRALALGARLADVTAKDEPVVILASSGIDAVAAIFGALAAGRPYVPIDPTQLSGQHEEIIRHSGARVIVGAAETVRSLSDRLDFEPIVLDIDAPLAEVDWSPEATADSLAYVMYTSGSTGAPKGVFQNQRGLAQDIHEYGEFVGLCADDVLSGLYSPTVVGSVRDIHAALVYGASLVLVSFRGVGLATVRRAIADNRVTILHAMPPVFRSLFANKEEPPLADLRLIYLAGDRLFSEDLVAVRRVVPENCAIYTGIGSTECATLYRHWFVPVDWPSDAGLLPVGHAIPGRRVDILRPDGSVAAPGEIGEIAVTSRFVALGYWGDPDRSARSFLPAPGEPGLRRFLPGDLGLIRADGLMEFHGRSDRQVKIRGYLIEPGQIEAQMRTITGVSEAAVVVTGRDGPSPQLVGFLEGEGIDVSGCRKALETVVASHLTPSRLIIVAAMPRLANFKVDYFELQKRADAPAATAGVVRPSGEVEAIVEEEFCRLLRLTAVSDRDSFRDLGGDSLLALELHLALEQKLGADLPVALFDNDFSITSLIGGIAALSARTSHRNPAARILVCPAPRSPRRAALALRDALGPSHAVSIMNYPPQPGSLPPDPAMLACALKDDPAFAENGDNTLVLLGYCDGARVAYELAMRHVAMGRRAPVLVIIDSPMRSHAVKFGAPQRSGALRAAAQNTSDLAIAWTGRRFRPIIEWIAGPAPQEGVGPIAWIRRKARKVVQFGQLQAWRPKQLFNAPALLVVSEDTRRNFVEGRADLGWSDVCQNLTVRVVPGNHVTIVRSPNLTEVAACVDRFVEGETRS